MKLSAALVVPALLSFAGVASAQYGYGGSVGGGMAPPPMNQRSTPNIGDEMQFVFGVDRVFGVGSDRTSLSADGDNGSSTTTTNISILGTSGSDNVFNTPRLSLDYFVVEGFSIGGSASYVSRSSTVTTTLAGNDTENDAGSTSAFLLNPRVGYAIQFDETFAFWPRAGLGFVFGQRTTSVPTQAGLAKVESSLSFIDLTLEAPFTISPSDNVAFLVGPYFDLPLTGKIEDTSAKSWGFGLTAGFVGYY
jgi:hypothetical protein